MAFFTLVQAFFFSQLFLTAVLSKDTQQNTVTFSNGIRFLFDTDGNQVDAYGSKINCTSILEY